MTESNGNWGAMGTGQMEEERRYAPIPLDEPHKLCRLQDVRIGLGVVRPASNDALHEILVRIFGRARKVAIWAETRGGFEAHRSPLCAYGPASRAQR